MRRFRTIRFYFKRAWWKYVIASILVLITVALDVIKPKLIGYAVDFIGQGEITEISFRFLIIALIVVFIARFVFSVIQSITLGGIFHKLYYEIKIRYMKCLLIQDARFFTAYHPGDLMDRATSDSHSVANVSTHLIFNLIQLIVMIVFSAVMMVLIHPMLALYSVLPLPFIFIVVVILRPKISANWRIVRRKNGDMSNKAMESVQHIKLIRAFVNEKQDYQKLYSAAEDCYKTERKSVFMQSAFGPTFRFFTIISQIVSYLYGAYCVMHQQITVGDLITFNIYLSQFSFPMLQLGNQVAMFSQSGVAFERMDEIMAATPDIIDKPNALAIDNFESIAFRDFSFTYPNLELAILQHINLTITNGKTLGIVGKTGSGKTTLVRQLLRQYPIADDVIIIDNQSMNDIQKKSMRQLVSYVPQEHQLFSRTVLENIELGKSDSSSFTAQQAIQMADFEKDIPYLPYGLQTIVGEYGVTLSGGQKQRLAIARAFIKDAKILILDDSLSAVDGTTEANIIANLRKLRFDKTNIIVAHRLTAVEAADEIIVLDEGMIIERGTHQDLMRRKGWYYHQYIVQEMGDDSDE